MDSDRPFEAVEDPRLLELIRSLRQQSPDSVHNQASDRYRTRLVNQVNDEKTSPLKIGMVVQSIPYLNWYKVHLGVYGTVGAAAVTRGSTSGPGARELNRFPVQSSVLCWYAPGMPYATIIGPVPQPASDSRFNLPIMLAKAGGYSAKTENCVNHLLDLPGAGGTVDFNAGRPLDDTSLDGGFMAETGVGVYSNSFEAVLQATEGVGVLASLFDGYVRISSRNFDEWWSGGERQFRADNGELSSFEGLAFYPWEAAGLYAKAEPFQSNEPEKVQRFAKLASIDIEDAELKRQRFYRHQRHAGYLARGVSQFIAAPPRPSGKRNYDDEDKDVGLFHEYIGAHGVYTLTAANRVSIVKDPQIFLPKRVKLVEDSDGDAADYAYSGVGAEAHQAKPIELDEDRPDLHLDAGAEEFQRIERGRAFAGFAKHEKDFVVAAGDSTPRSNDSLDFAAIANGGRLQLPSTADVRVDDVAGQVQLFLSRCGIHLEPNGDVRIVSGSGSSIIIGSDIRIESPGDLVKHVGRSEISLCGRDHIIRANNSCDVSTTRGNVSVKAQKSLFFFAANDDAGADTGRGAIVFECRSAGKGHDYEGKQGEDVGASGVVFKVPNSEFAVLAADVYLRSGDHQKLKDGAITLDAGRGQNPIFLYGRSVDAYLNTSVGFWFGAQEESSDVQRAHLFTRGSASLQGSLIVDGVIVGSDSAVFGGSVLAAGSIVCGGRMGDSVGTFIGKAPGAGGTASFIVSSAIDAQSEIADVGSTVHEGLVKRYYGEFCIGGDDTIDHLGFSFRDDKDQRQYLSQNLKLVEPRWQTLERLGAATGLFVWKEKPVSYQDEKLYPWPGRKAWTEDETTARIDASPLYDYAFGRDAVPDSEGIAAYLDGEAGKLEFAVPSDAYKIPFKE